MAPGQRVKRDPGFHLQQGKKCEEKGSRGERETKEGRAVCSHHLRPAQQGRAAGGPISEWAGKRSVLEALKGIPLSCEEERADTCWNLKHTM